MDNRSFDANAQPAPPTAPVLPSIGYPNNGDPVTPTPPTYPGAWWFHQMGEELRAILTAAGVTPNRDTLNQLLTALRAAGVFTTPALGDRTTKAATMACFSQEFAASILSNGYQKLPSGLIVQWGSAGHPGPPSVGVNFALPIAFTTSFFALTGIELGASPTIGFAWVPAGLSQFTLYSSHSGASTCSWIALGI